MNQLIKKILVASTAALMAVTFATTTNAASVHTATATTIHTQTKRTYNYAKKMLIKNRTGLSGKTSAILARKLIRILVHLLVTPIFTWSQRKPLSFHHQAKNFIT